MDIETVCGHLAQLIEQGRSANAMELVAELLGKLKDENLRLALELFKLMKQHTGRRGEGFTSEQLDLFLQLLGQGTDAESTMGDDAPDVETAAEVETPPSPPPKKKDKPRRQKLPAHLPRTTTLIEVPEEQRQCPVHGDKSCIGHDQSEVLHFQPASFWVELIRREKLACRECGDQVAVAPPANKVVDGGMAGPGLIADLLVGKCGCQPATRQKLRTVGAMAGGRHAGLILA